MTLFYQQFFNKKNQITQGKVLFKNIGAIKTIKKKECSIINHGF
jgi:hypothetical protein